MTMTKWHDRCDNNTMRQTFLPSLVPILLVSRLVFIKIQDFCTTIYNDLRPSVFTSYCLTQNHCHYVKYKSLENSSLNKFQVIVFETIAIKCWKMNWCSFMFWNSFVQLKIMTMYFQSLQYLEVKLIIITIFYYFLKP